MECSSSWAFAVAGMLSDMCCGKDTDYGWLSPQELISCDRKGLGCNGGWPTNALNYVNFMKGLVHEGCFPYVGRNDVCTETCADHKDWRTSHVCDCIGGYKHCYGIIGIKSCLQRGPITLALGVCKSFFNYGGGIYLCDCKKKYLGVQVIEAVGYANSPACHWIGKNSWGSKWGEQGFFKIACMDCSIDGEYPNGNTMCEKVH